MKRVLIYSVFCDFNSVELALEHIERGNDVYLLECDSSLRICSHNTKGNWLMCKYCMYSMHKVIKELKLKKRVHFSWLSSIINPDDKHLAHEFSPCFNSIQELKDLTYKGFQVGYGAFSSYVTFSRNVMPEITDDFKRYIQFFIEKEVVVINALERLHRENGFDLIIFHNGRFAQFKPFLEFARINSIEYISTEHRVSDGKLLKNLFYNDIPHSLDAIAKKVFQNWDRGCPDDRDDIGRSFYEKRKVGLQAGDKVYVKDQIVGELPDCWDERVENIVIFNSSEHEFCSVSRDYDKNMLFPNQYIALNEIFEKYKEDTTKHFYLRIHPNLKTVPFRSHLSLYELNYENVTIIPAESSISSYSLMEKASKIIVFNSTMGPESAYWGKPVIALTKYVYWNLGLLYHPETPKQLWELIDNKELKVKANHNLIKYGYWLIHPNLPEVRLVPYRRENFRILGKRFSGLSITRIGGSYKTSIVIEWLLNKTRVLSSFSSIPCLEPYVIVKDAK